MSLRMLFSSIRPDLCWIGLFPLIFRHLSKGMLFARCRKQKEAERNSDDPLANERSHNALAQLSASGGACKAKALVVIERRPHGVTITRGGPHRKTQRVERSVRSRSAFCRHATFFRADFLYAEGYTVVVLVWSCFAGESSCSKFHCAA